MECNKEEAVRAKSLAETKMQNKDFAGARKMAIKAQKLYNELDKISHILIICDVHCAAELKVSGTEMDWYGILQIERTADETTIKKQYRKFALLLHPDKNNFPGAESAFKLIGEAQRVLLDKGKRSLHDMKRSVSRPAQGSTYSSNSGTQNGFNGCVGGSNYQHQRPQQPATQPGSGNSRRTFWTDCPFCQSRYQYYVEIINRSVVCQHCHKPFIAHEKSAQGMPTVKKFSQPVFHPRNDAPQGAVKVDVGSQRNASKGHSKVESEKKQGTVKVEVGLQGNSTKGHSKVESQKKPTDGMAAPVNSSRKRSRKKDDFIVSSDSESSSSDKDEEPMMPDVGDLGSYKECPRRSVRSKQKVSYQENKSDDEESRTPQKKAKENGSTAESMQSSVDAVARGNNKSNTEDLNKDDETRNVKEKEEMNKNGSMRSCEDQNDSDSDAGQEMESVPYICPDPEFNDFDKKRDVKLFQAGNIWAIYDDFSGMPRFYARINRVISGGLKFRITWLEADPNSDNEQEWVSAGFPISCGKFKLGSSTDVADLNLFSHQAEWEKGNRFDAYEIVPRKGEIWALFKNWDINWKSQTDHTKRDLEYDFVEILSNFSENKGVSVLYLGKLKGFVSLFCRISNKPVQIKSTELLRFSHQVPSFTMTGEERDGVPNGSFELDPASIPEKMEEIDVPRNLEGRDGDRNSKDVHSEFPCEVEPEVASAHDPHAKFNGTPAESDHPETEQVPDSLAESDDPDTEQVQDPEYFDFDGEKAIEKFEKGQIWSVYCDEDSLPKYYALVTKVDKLMIKIKWLRSAHLPSGVIKWADKKMVTTCGRFKATGGSNEYESTGPFSHLVNAESVGRSKAKNEYNIVPSEGEVWAMYKDWTHTLSPSDLDTCEYDVVQVLERNELQIKVSYLERVKGHNSVFRALANQGSSGTAVNMSELLRFSHRIPAFQLTEEHGCLSGFWELDSAALPARYFT